MRHLRPTCALCIYWVEDKITSSATAGHCHPHPPGIYIHPDTGVVVQKFPMTDHHQWCGEWSDDDSRLTQAVRRSVMRQRPPA